ncbi:CFEM-domain-containing protein [Aspergillus campestris IBT 28561]|uniref:CFEM-domain-containing protein n=1 Tax=Aspergillus campestris (strain IBT 28561) TaxID=1392248 RepID=A0A2I1D8B4_ASPC2|nr:CFEM-domain-containing protein [Aspergillus campestris IBT 28561]PKY06114.1 CFEM-domain-containing protein [Aspergillus campestris IBT 28561]
MKSLLAFASVLAAALVSAQTLPDIPGCSMQCFLDALMNDGCPGLMDFGCHCQKPELVSKVTPCVKSSCGIPEQATVSDVVMKQCASAGHAISIPPVGEATPTATATSSTDTASSSVSPPSNTMSSSGTGAVTETPSGAGSMTLPTESSTGGPQPGSSNTASPTHKTSTSSTSSTMPGQTHSGGAAPPVFTGDATHVKHNIAGVAAAAAAIVLF